MKSPQPEQRCSLKRNIIDSSSEAASKKSRIDLSNRTFLLSSGQNMPVVQFGTYKMKGEECYQERVHVCVFRDIKSDQNKDALHILGCK